MAEIKGLAEVLAKHPLFEGFDAETMAFLEGCAANEVFQAGSYIFKADDPAERFFLLRQGDVALELPRLLARLREAGGEVDDVEVKAPSLHSVFIHLTGRELRE